MIIGYVPAIFICTSNHHLFSSEPFEYELLKLCLGIGPRIKSDDFSNK
jgi:hypothetical protein